MVQGVNDVSTFVVAVVGRLGQGVVDVEFYFPGVSCLWGKMNAKGY